MGGVTLTVFELVTAMFAAENYNLSAKTNRIIGGKAPSVSLTNIEKQSNMDRPRLDEILKTHIERQALAVITDGQVSFLCTFNLLISQK